MHLGLWTNCKHSQLDQLRRLEILNRNVRIVLMIISSPNRSLPLPFFTKRHTHTHTRHTRTHIHTSYCQNQTDIAEEIWSSLHFFFFLHCQISAPFLVVVLWPAAEPTLCADSWKLPGVSIDLIWFFSYNKIFPFARARLLVGVCLFNHKNNHRNQISSHYCDQKFPWQ